MVVVPFAGLDLYGILHVVSRRDMIRATVKILEHYMDVCREQGKKYGPAAGQVVVIFDMQDFNLRPFMWRPGNYCLLSTTKIKKYSSRSNVFFFSIFFKL